MFTSLPWSQFSAAQLAALGRFLDGRPHTRADIASAVGQSAPSAASHIETLVERGLVAQVGSGTDEGADDSDGQGSLAGGAHGHTADRHPADGRQAAGRQPAGRPAAMWRLRPAAAASVGMELRAGGPRNAAARLCTRIVLLDGSVAFERVTPVRRGELRSIRSVIEREWAATAGAPQAKEIPVVALGIALPGVVDFDRRSLIHAPNLFLSNVEFAQIENSIGVPLYVDNEANTAALAEYLLWTHGRMPQSLVRISITEGVGAGIIVDGKLVRGATWRAGEFGHMAIREGRRSCNCGRSGCWEQYVSERALLGDARTSGTGCRTIGGLIRRVALGEPAAVHVWRQYVHNLATGIENIAACVDPAAIVVGGEIADAGDLLVGPLRREVEGVSFLTSGIRVGVSRGSSRAASIGAALLPFADLYPGSPAMKEGVA